jgi:hypothetical protein
VQHLSLDRFIEPASTRRRGSSFQERIGLETSIAAARSIARGDATLCPGYDPLTRERGPSDVFQFSGEGVLVIDGLLATTVDIDGALRIAVEADASHLASRRASFHSWKASLRSIEDADEYEKTRADEDDVVAEATAAAALKVTIDPDFRLRPR